jgi:hypothetical protein
MTIFNLWIFDEKGSLLYYKEWLRKKHTSMEKDEVSFQKKKIAFTAAAPAVTQWKKYPQKRIVKKILIVSKF